MSLFSRLYNRKGANRKQQSESVNTEVDHWNETERRTQAGERLFWLNHPRVAHHYYRKGLVEGTPWREWMVRQRGGPAELALELGCGNGAALAGMLKEGVAKRGVGQDLDRTRFEALNAEKDSITFLAGDVNEIQLQPNSYDLVYALQSFHHFEALDHIMAQVNAALTDDGFFVLDEYVGPARFQWTDLQLSLTAQLLGMIPKELRCYIHGLEKRAEGRSTPEEVMRVCPSEAVRSNEIIPAFYRHFDVLQHRNLGGTIQHLLYSGIVHNFPDNDPAVDRIIDSIDGIEGEMINHGMLPSDFVLLIGKKKKINPDLKQ